MDLFSNHQHKFCTCFHLLGMTRDVAQVTLLLLALRWCSWSKNSLWVRETEFYGINERAKVTTLKLSLTPSSFTTRRETAGMTVALDHWCREGRQKAIKICYWYPNSTFGCRRSKVISMMAEKMSKLEIMFERNRAFDLNRRHCQRGAQGSQRNTESISNWGILAITLPLTGPPENMLRFRFLRLQKDLSFAERAPHTFWRESTGCETAPSRSGPRRVLVGTLRLSWPQGHQSEDTGCCCPRRSHEKLQTVSCRVLLTIFHTLCPPGTEQEKLQTSTASGCKCRVTCACHGGAIGQRRCTSCAPLSQAAQSLA